VKVNDRDFHTGAVCESGFNCSSGRELCDNFDIDVNPIDGSAGLAYGVFGGSGSFFARQVSGTSAFASKSIVDRSLSCPTPVNNCLVGPLAGSPCIGPDFLTVVADPPGASDLPPVALASEDIRSVGVGEPAGVGDALVFTIRVAALNPDSLPPNVFWRVLWTSPLGQRYVDVMNCASGGLSSHYGHFTTGSVQDGVTDGYTVGSDGRITITIARSKVDNPGPGTLLTAINADCRTVTGTCPPTAAAFAPNDVTDSGQYLVVGNGYCAPLALACGSDVSGGPGDHVVSVPVSNPSLATRTAHVTVSDPNGWIVGGPASLDVGPIPPGGSADASVTVRMPGDCSPAADDPLLFHVSAADLPTSSECTRTTHCSTVAGVNDGGVPRELALAITGANPFRGSTAFSYAVPRRSNVRLDVYSVNGRRVRTLVNGELDPGRYTASLDAAGSGQPALGSGLYFVSLLAGGEKRTLTVISIR
jgi:hypothetical protein